MIETKPSRGFATLDILARKEMAGRGGRAAHKSGRAHQWTKEEAKEAGRLGGIAARDRNRQETSDVSNRATS